MSTRAFVEAQLRALAEVAAAELATVSVVIEQGRAALDALEDRAVVEGYAVAHASLDEHGLHGLPEVVRALAASVHLGSARSKKRGLVAALGTFADKHGKPRQVGLCRSDQRARDEVGNARDLPVIDRQRAVHLDACPLGTEGNQQGPAAALNGLGEEVRANLPLGRPGLLAPHRDVVPAQDALGEERAQTRGDLSRCRPHLEIPADPWLDLLLGPDLDRHLVRHVGDRELKLVAVSAKHDVLGERQDGVGIELHGHGCRTNG
jgi:hypothetical protein